MQVREVPSDGGRRFAVIMDQGDETVEALRRFARDAGVSGARVAGAGAFLRAVIRRTGTRGGDETEIALGERIDVVAIDGEIVTTGEIPEPRLAVTVRTSDGSITSGTLVRGEALPTLALMIVESGDLAAGAHEREPSDRVDGGQAAG